MLRQLSLCILLALTSHLALAETLYDVLKREVPDAPVPPANVQLPITSYALLNDYDYFGIAYYIVSASDPGLLEPPLRILLFDKHTTTWKHREFADLETKMLRTKSSCLGSVLSFKRILQWFVIGTHFTPSAGCSAILTHGLTLKHTLYGWPVAWFSSGLMIFERNEIHFATTHPLELGLYNPAKANEVPLLPQKDDLIWKQLTEDIGDTADPDWCRVNNASCEPDQMDGSLVSIKVNDTTQAVALKVIYNSYGCGPKTEEFVGDAEVIYIFDLANGHVRHREFRQDVLQKQYGTVDLEKLIEPASLQYLFAAKK